MRKIIWALAVVALLGLTAAALWRWWYPGARVTTMVRDAYETVADNSAYYKQVVPETAGDVRALEVLRWSNDPGLILVKEKSSRMIKPHRDRFWLRDGCLWPAPDNELPDMTGLWVPAGKTEAVRGTPERPVFADFPGKDAMVARIWAEAELLFDEYNTVCTRAAWLCDFNSFEQPLLLLKRVTDENYERLDLRFYVEGKGWEGFMSYQFPRQGEDPDPELDAELRRTDRALCAWSAEAGE